MTPVICTLLQLIAGAPYAANERAADATPALRTALRGLIVGMILYFNIGPVTLGLWPVQVRGGFDPRFLLALPITLG